MKILLLADGLANARQWINGLEKYTDARVITWNISNVSRSRRVFSWFRALFIIRKLVSDINPDILIGYRLTSYGFLAAWSGRRPLVLAAEGVTDVWPLNHWTTPLKSALAKYAIRHADMIHAWGDHMTASMIEHGAKGQQLFVMPRGIDPTLFYFNPSEKKAPEKNKTIYGCVSRSLFPEYGHLVILRALKKLVEEGYDMRIFFAGAGPELKKLQTFTDENNLDDKVMLLGFIPNNELPEYLRKSHFYLSMPETEGVSTSLLEAMGCGCYPVVTNLPANRGFIQNGENGNLVDIGDDDQLYKCIKNVINTSELFDKALEYNRQFIAEEADISRNMQCFVTEYARLINSENNVRN